MKNIIKTTQLANDKSAFLVDLVQHESGLHYIEIIQSFLNDAEGENNIKINPVVLDEIIQILEEYRGLIPRGKMPAQILHITDIEQLKIQENYLKGVSTSDLAIQIGEKEEFIKLVLKYRGIKIADNKVPKFKYGRRRRYR